MFVDRYPLNRLRRNNLGEKSAKTQSEATFVMLGKAYADAHPTINNNGTCGQDMPYGVIHGAAYKPQDTALMDYVHYQYNTYMVKHPIPLSSDVWLDLDLEAFSLAMIICTLTNT